MAFVEQVGFSDPHVITTPEVNLDLHLRLWFRGSILGANRTCVPSFPTLCLVVLKARLTQIGIFKAFWQIAVFFY